MPSNAAVRLSTTRDANQVLPTPPDPVSVSRRTSSRIKSPRMTPSSCSRPMNFVSGFGS
jgi:hypothetical protein